MARRGVSAGKSRTPGRVGSCDVCLFRNENSGTFEMGGICGEITIADRSRGEAPSQDMSRNGPESVGEAGSEHHMGSQSAQMTFPIARTTSRHTPSVSLANGCGSRVSFSMMVIASHCATQSFDRLKSPA